MKTNLLIIVTLFQLMFICINAQNNQYDTQGVIRNNLGSLIKNEFGDNYGFDFMVLDSIIMHYEEYLTTNKFSDPYGTLKSCVLFYAFPYYGENNEFKIEDSAIVGIYRDGLILWYSEPVLTGYSVNLNFTGEINKDGKVEVILSTSEFKQCSVERLWIINWDGIIGHIINDYNVENGQSKLVVWNYEIFDYEGDETYEIISETPDMCEVDNWYPTELITAKTRVTYGWNGYKYGLWLGIKQINANEFLPADRMIISVQCRVSKTNDLYTYNYLWKNDSTSLQSIGKIYLLEVNPEANTESPHSKFNDWNVAKSEIIENCLLWTNSGMDASALIKPAEKLNGFVATNNNPPKIIKYYVQGSVPEPVLTDSLGNLLDQAGFINNIMNNSITGYSIGPNLSLDSINSSVFIDTLLVFPSQSLYLGWITTQNTADKYDSLFTSAKTQLQQNNNNIARATLQTVLQQVDIDSTYNLKSEAYALLRYNTEYLLEKMPQSSPNLLVNLKSSTGTLLTTGSLQYYEGSWKDAVSNGDGTFTVITSQNNVSLRMTYEYAQQTVNNIVAHNNTYTFQTVSANVQLKNSLGSPIDTGTVQYYAGAWRTLGTTANGVATKELLPINYSFRMTYEYASIDKQQNLSTNPNVVFQTVNAQVHLKNSLGNFIDVGTVQYYAGAWRSFGTTTNGVATKELLPINYSFRITYEYSSIDKQQNLSVDPIVVFQTVNAQVQLKNNLGNLIDQGTVQYYAGAWRTFGTTTNGVATKELLPINYSFRMTYEYASIDKQQNLSVDPTVVFQTINATVQLKNSLGNLIDQGTVQYYAGAWRSFGTTTNGVATKELLPINYSFRMTHEFLSKDKQQNLSTNSVVDFQTVLCTVKVTNSTNQPINNANVKYYAGSWRDLGTTNAVGITTKELLPQNISFRASYGSTSLDKQQDINTNNLVEIMLNVP